MTEPSVLDYLKSILDPRKPRIRLADYKEENADQIVDEQFPQEPALSLEETGIMPVPKKIRSPFRWRISLAILCLLIGQISFEPPNQKLLIGVAFYAIGSVILLLSIYLRDWQFSTIPEVEKKSDLIPWQINWVAFAIGTISLSISFILLSDNVFNAINLGFWLFAILCYTQAFTPEDLITQFMKWLNRIYNFKPDYSKDVNISWWKILIVLSAILILFFRFYQLNQVPGEMFSDHAEKLADVTDILNGQYGVYFPRNTGREGFQMYLTAIIAQVFGTGISFISLKLGTVLAGLFTLPFIYLLGKEIANKHVGFLAFFLTGIAYWPNVISRVGLRFPLYPLFVAPTLYYLIRGLRQSRKKDFVLAGLFLGIGLHGYSPIRMLPIVVIIGVLIYCLHMKTKEEKIGSVYGLIVIGIMSFVVFMPLLHYVLGHMDIFSYRAMTRLGTIEAEYPGNPFWIFLVNLFNAMVMFFWKNGEVWVHSIPNRPALDIVSAVFYFIGSSYVMIRYIKKRNWVDLFLLLSVPLLLMPSIMSIAFPGENPSLNRSGGAIIPVFILIAIGLEGLLRTLVKNARLDNKKPYLAYSIGFLFIGFALVQNYALVFDQYKTRFYFGSWNTSEMGAVIEEFASTYGDYEHAYVVPYDYWVDTTLVGIAAQNEVINIALWPDQFESTLEYKGAKLIIVKPDDYSSIESLQALYPTSVFWRYIDQYPEKDFLVLFIAPAEPNVIIQEQTN